MGIFWTCCLCFWKAWMAHGQPYHIITIDYFDVDDGVSDPQIKYINSFVRKVKLTNSPIIEKNTKRITLCIWSTLYRSRPSSTRVLFWCNNCNGVVVLTWTSLDTHRCLMIWWSPSLSFDCIPRHRPKQCLWISPRHLSTNIFSPNPVRLAIQRENTGIYFFSWLFWPLWLFAALDFYRDHVRTFVVVPLVQLVGFKRNENNNRT